MYYFSYRRIFYIITDYSCMMPFQIGILPTLHSRAEKRAFSSSGPPLSTWRWWARVKLRGFPNNSSQKERRRVRRGGLSERGSGVQGQLANWEMYRLITAPGEDIVGSYNNHKPTHIYLSSSSVITYGQKCFGVNSFYRKVPADTLLFVTLTAARDICYRLL